MNVFSDLAWAPQRPDSAVFLIRAGLSLSLSRNSQYCSYLLQLLQSTCRALSPSFSFSEDEKWSERTGWREETWLLASRTLSGSILNTLTVSKLWIVRVIRIILI